MVYQFERFLLKTVGMTDKFLLSLRVLTVFAASAVPLAAQSSLRAFGEIEAGYADFDFVEQPDTRLLAGGFDPLSDGSPIDVSASEDFGDMTFSARVRASSTFRNLRTYAEGTLENSFFVPYFPAEGEPQGLENYFNAYGSASFTDTLSYGGTAIGYNSRYILNLSGSILGPDAFNFVVLQHANQPVQTWLFSAEGDYDIQLVSNSFVHGTFPQEFTLTLFSFFQAYTGFLTDGETSTGYADFENTLTLAGVELRDENGVLQPNGSITSASGTAYDIIAIPEPSASLLALLGPALLFAKRRR